MAGSPLNEAQFTGHSGSHQKTAPTPFFTGISWKQGTYVYLLVNCHFQEVIKWLRWQHLLPAPPWNGAHLSAHPGSHSVHSPQASPSNRVHDLHPSSLSRPRRQRLTAVMASTVSISLKTKNMLAITLEVTQHILHVHVLEAGRILVDCHIYEVTGWLQWRHLLSASLWNRTHSSCPSGSCLLTAMMVFAASISLTQDPH